MDEMNITSKFTTKIISKIISTILNKKLGYRANIQLKGLNVKIIDGKAKVHLDIDAEIDKDELTKIIGDFI